ncbi:hypothetical protein CDD81_7634 [Ophiocordyceps australis]|uniref:DUS-like FMN-binding domain-containing protein n=1 Tax=Ophiocordyceps australis TaxID=1399860 RepID=A0A2C5Y3M1_9HYPO|nr:hypothetical protein CDD81_7634 [Ophiocordyceps australis]
MASGLAKRFMATQAKRVAIPRRGADYRGKVVLAPMVRTGELPIRLLALQHGADLVWGPETVDRAMIGSSRRFDEETKTVEWYRMSTRAQKDADMDAPETTVFRMCPEREGDRLIFQIGTADPERAVEAARLVAADVAGIDVNAGCPKSFSTSGGMGAALLCTPDKLCAILEALVQKITPEFEIGISVKIRILETAAATEALVRRLCATGITGLTVHCRTTPMRPRERAIRDQLGMVVQVCHEHGVACLMNGDVVDRDEGLALAQEYGADGAMIATAAEKNPSCFRTQAQGGLLAWRELAEQYILTSMDIRHHFGKTKYSLAQIIPGKESVRQKVVQNTTHAGLCKDLGLESLLQRARQIDATMGLQEAEEKQTRKKQANPSAKAAGGKMGLKRQASQQRQKTLQSRPRQGQTQPPSVAAL